MAKKDLEIFIEKVSQLNKLLSSLEEVPGRKDLITACKTHDEVVKLAKSWGYEIGRRWGENK